MEFIHAPKACASVGPYSHCVKAGSTYYLCGQVPFHPVTGEVVGNGMKEQAVQTLANMKAVLEAAGLAVTDIAKTTVFVTNMDDFAAFNEVYAASMVSVWKSATLPTAVCWKWMPSALKSKGRGIGPLFVLKRYFYKV